MESTSKPEQLKVLSVEERTNPQGITSSREYQAERRRTWDQERYVWIDLQLFRGESRTDGKRTYGLMWFGDETSYEVVDAQDGSEGIFVWTWSQPSMSVGDYDTVTEAMDDVLNMHYKDREFINTSVNQNL